MGPKRETEKGERPKLPSRKVSEFWKVEMTTLRVSHTIFTRFSHSSKFPGMPYLGSASKAARTSHHHQCQHLVLSLR